MVLSERDRSIMGTGMKGFGGRGAATKAMLGLNPASTMPNYTLGMNAGAAQPTYKNNGVGRQGANRNPQSIINGQYSMFNSRLPNQSNDIDGPRGNDQVWQVVGAEQIGGANGGAGANQVE